jgi:SH3 domain protein
MKKLILFSLLLCFTPLVQGETVRYVSDNLSAALRAGAGDRFKIVRMLSSGSAVTVLQVDEKNGYSLVRPNEGMRGWILTRELMDTPSARQSMASTQQALEQAKAENARLQQEIAKLAPGGGDILSRYQQLLEENERLGQELARLRKLSSSNLNLDEQNRILQERIVTLERELQITQQERQSLADSRQNTLFLLGAGVLLGGLILGWILPGRSGARSNPWGEL